MLGATWTWFGFVGSWIAIFPLGIALSAAVSRFRWVGWLVIAIWILDLCGLGTIILTNGGGGNHTATFDIGIFIGSLLGWTTGRWTWDEIEPPGWSESAKRRKLDPPTSRAEAFLTQMDADSSVEWREG